MQAILFAAGLGTRLKPLTDQVPKALIKVAGKPIIQWNLEKLIAAGCHHIIINVHHFPEQIIQFLSQNHNFGIQIVMSDESDEILDTGGALLKAAPLFVPNEPIVAHNVDILSNLDIRILVKEHLEKQVLATLVVRDRQTQRYLLFNKIMHLEGWMNVKSGEKILAGHTDTAPIPLAFSGIQVINPGLLSLIQQTGNFSIISTYLELAANYPIYGYQDTSSLWMDIGKPDQLEMADWVMANQIERAHV